MHVVIYRCNDDSFPPTFFPLHIISPYRFSIHEQTISGCPNQTHHLLLKALRTSSRVRPSQTPPRYVLGQADSSNSAGSWQTTDRFALRRPPKSLRSISGPKSTLKVLRLLTVKGTFTITRWAQHDASTDPFSLTMSQHRIQPIEHKQALDPKHVHVTAPAVVREHKEEMLPEHQETLQKQRTMHSNQQTTGDVEKSHAHLGTHVNQHEHHHIHETGELQWNYIAYWSVSDSEQFNLSSRGRPFSLPLSTTRLQSMKRSMMLLSSTRSPLYLLSATTNSWKWRRASRGPRTPTRDTNTSSVSRRRGYGVVGCIANDLQTRVLRELAVSKLLPPMSLPPQMPLPTRKFLLSNK